MRNISLKERRKIMIEWPDFLRNGLPLGDKLSSVTVGVFDGVHLGHQALIERVVSHDTDNIPVVITFRQNHKAENNAENIQTFRQKAAMFGRLGLKIILVVDFNESFKRMAGIEFLELLLKHGKIGFLAVGAQFRCGHKLDTDAVAIRDFFALRNIPVEIVPEVMQSSRPISSSRIRSAIIDGNLKQAQAMLGRPHTIDLAGEPGIGLPGLVLPPPGVYSVVLREKPEDKGTKAVILIQKDNVRILEPFTGPHWEFAELTH
jgi:riboflavin kinase/FMN adenylyltransferase